MLPRLYDFGRFSLPTYGVMAAVGLICGLIVTAKFARRRGLDVDLVWNLGILSILAALVGAKLLFLVNGYSYYRQHPAEILSFDTLQAGGAWYGGVIFGVMVGWWYMRRHSLPLLRTLDVFAPGIALGHAFGRLGCFSAGCCYGKPTNLPWGVTFTNPLASLYTGTPLGVPLHPTQIYEFLVELGNFALLALLFQTRRRDGQMMGAYLFLYGLARYFIEFLRGDPDRGSLFGGMMSNTQFISIFIVIAGGLLWMRWRREPVAEATAQA